MMGNTSFYESLNLPWFSPPSITFAIVWPILYILIAASIYLVWDNSDKEYKKYLLINYITNQLFTILFFVFNKLFLSFVDTFIVLISSLYLYYKTKEINKKAGYLLIPYIIWNTFATILSLTIFLINT